jgi:hypothetical protein
MQPKSKVTNRKGPVGFYSVTKFECGRINGNAGIPSVTKRIEVGVKSNIGISSMIEIRRGLCNKGSMKKESESE